MGTVTLMLAAIDKGDRASADQLMPLVYNELRELAAAKLAREQHGAKIQPSSLVHEAYLRLVDQNQPSEWNGRSHFFAAAAEAMRRILVENARRRKTQKHGGNLRRLEMDSSIGNAGPDHEVLALDEALTMLEARWPDKALLVKLRYFSGFTVAESAQAMKISVATAERYWTFSRAWLHSHIHSDD